jgi:hypothetical protein
MTRHTSPAGIKACTSAPSKKDVTDEQRVWALMALAAKAEEGDEAAKATMAAVERLFARAGCPK